MFEMSLCCIAERFGEAKGEEFDDASPNPWKWSPARVLRWVRGYQGGKFAAALEHDACFTVLDGAELCRMGVGTVLHMNRPDNVLLAHASVIEALKALAPRGYSSGEPCCAVLCWVVVAAPRLAVTIPCLTVRLFLSLHWSPTLCIHVPACCAFHWSLDHRCTSRDYRKLSAGLA